MPIARRILRHFIQGPSAITGFTCDRNLTTRIARGAVACSPLGHHLPSSSPFGAFTGPHHLRRFTSATESQQNDDAPRIHFVKDEAYLTMDVGSAKTTFRVYEERPISNLLAALHEEDPALNVVSIRDGTGPDSARWARSTIGSDILEVAMKRGELALDLNGKTLAVQVQPLHERLEPLDREMLSIKEELQPLEERKLALDAAAERRASMVSWAVLTRKEYTYEVLHELTVSNSQRALYARKKFDFVRYSELKEKLRELDHKKEDLYELYGVDEPAPPTL
ncbi:hypothetical protein HDU67_002920 [Dinochytrium kinnereticum]|nr:hypothetical protein HDU67_002920 [Dinochytrium kinnereticum]